MQLYTRAGIIEESQLGYRLRTVGNIESKVSLQWFEVNFTLKLFPNIIRTSDCCDVNLHIK